MMTTTKKKMRKKLSMDAAATFRFVESKTRLVIKLRATIQDNIRNIGPYVIA